MISRLAARARLGPAIAIALSLGMMAASGCKRSLAPKVEEVWDEAPAVGQAEALASLAPPWPAPTHAMLDSGLTTHWLHEPDTPVSHLRVLLPTGGPEALRSASLVAVLQMHLETALRGQANGRGIVVDARHGADRIELALHAPTDELPRALTVIGTVLGARAPQSALLGAREALLEETPARLPPPELATSALVATLLGRVPTNQRIDREALEALDDETLLEGWEALVDPRRAVLVVHAGESATSHRNTLRHLATRWRGLGRRKVAASTLERLRAAPPPPAGGGHLLADPPTPLRALPSVDDDGRATLVLGRVIPTPTAEDRSLARLAQRVLQEELDASLVIRGDYGLLLVRVPLSSREPERSATEAIDHMTALATTRQPAQRLFVAAQLWLGARVVQASLDGEDWTALWSEALDLAVDDREVAGALARDAATMLEPDPQALQAWLARWLDPRAGEVGWRWIVAGADDGELRRLARITQVEQVGG